MKIKFDSFVYVYATNNVVLILKQVKINVYWSKQHNNLHYHSMYKPLIKWKHICGLCLASTFNNVNIKNLCVKLKNIINIGNDEHKY